MHVPADRCVERAAEFGDGAPDAGPLGALAKTRSAVPLVSPLSLERGSRSAMSVDLTSVTSGRSEALKLLRSTPPFG